MKKRKPVAVQRPSKDLKSVRRLEPKNNQIDRTDRILKLYHCLRSAEDGLPINELQTQVQHLYNSDINEQSIRKNIQRDLEKLAAMLVTGQVYCVTKKGNQPNEYFLSEDASMQEISSELALVLVMANNYLRQYLPFEVYHKVEGFFESAAQQLEKNTQLCDWQTRIRFIPASYHSDDTNHYDTDETQTIYQALLNDESWLECLYRREGETEPKQYTIKPHGIIQHGNKQYLMASKLVNQRTELRTFNIQRFDHVEFDENEHVVVEVDSYDLDILVEEKEYEMAYFEREELCIKLRCENYLKEELKSYPLDKFQRISYQDGDHFTLDANCMITQSVLDWLVEKSHSVQVLEPQELFEKVKVHVLAAQQYYDLDYEDLERYKIFEGAVDNLDELIGDEIEIENE